MYTSNKFLDTLIEHHKLKNDAALAKALKVDPPVISKIRHGINAVSAKIILRTYDLGGMTIEQIYELAR